MGLLLVEQIINKNVWRNKDMMGYGYRIATGWWFVWLIRVILIGIILYAIYKIAIGKGGGTSSIYDTSDSRALEILKERYAKGEIDEKEYEKMREAIKK